MGITQCSTNVYYALAPLWPRRPRAPLPLTLLLMMECTCFAYSGHILLPLHVELRRGSHVPPPFHVATPTFFTVPPKPSTTPFPCEVTEKCQHSLTPSFSHISRLENRNLCLNCATTLSEKMASSVSGWHSLMSYVSITTRTIKEGFVSISPSQNVK